MFSNPSSFSTARNSSRKVSSPSPRTMKSTPAAFVHVGFRGQTWIVASTDDANVRTERTNQFHDAKRRFSLECHNGHSDDVGLVLAHQLLDGFSDSVLSQNEVGGGHLVMGDRRCRRARRGRRWACAPPRWACARRNPALPATERSRGLPPFRARACLAGFGADIVQRNWRVKMGRRQLKAVFRKGPVPPKRDTRKGLVHGTV